MHRLDPATAPAPPHVALSATPRVRLRRLGVPLAPLMLLLALSACVPSPGGGGGGAVPSGTVVAFAGGTVPEGWTLCDGRTTPTGIKTPDLRGRFLRGGGKAQPQFPMGGSDQHSHTLSSASNRIGVDVDNDAAAATASHTHEVGAADHLPPFVELAYILKD